MALVFAIMHSEGVDLGEWQVKHFHKTVGAKLGSTLRMAWHNTTTVQLPLNYVIVLAFEFKSNDSLL